MHGGFTKPVRIATIPQLINMRAIQIRGTILCSRKLLGISKMKYPKKNIPATNPNSWLLIASSLFMVKAANPTLIRSTKAIMYMYRTTINGMIRLRSLPTVRVSMSVGASAVLEDKLISFWSPVSWNGRVSED
jgi:hypothetical protein